MKIGPLKLLQCDGWQLWEVIWPIEGIRLGADCPLLAPVSKFRIGQLLGREGRDALVDEASSFAKFGGGESVKLVGLRRIGGFRDG